MSLLQVPAADDLRRLMEEARKTALRFHHDFIHSTHFFAAMLTVDCEAQVFCRDVDKEKCLLKVEKQFAAHGTAAEGDSLPLTLLAEHIIQYAGELAKRMKSTETTSVHVLLVLLSIPSDAAISIEKTGIAFEDVAMAYAGRPLERVIPKLRAFRAIPFWRRWFLGAASRSAKEKIAFDSARNCWDLGLNDQCIAVCRAGLDLDPKSFRLRSYLVSAYSRKRCFREAVDNLEIQYKDYPNNKNYLLNLAHFYNGLEISDQAEEVNERLLAAFPEDESVLNNAGFNLLLLKKYTEAAALLEKATVLYPDAAFPWNNLGFAKFKLGQVAEGLALVDRSLELDKGNSYAYKNKGIILLEQGKKEEAIENFQLALKFRYTEKYGPEVNEYLERIRTAAHD